MEHKTDYYKKNEALAELILDCVSLADVLASCDVLNVGTDSVNKVARIICDAAGKAETLANELFYIFADVERELEEVKSMRIAEPEEAAELFIDEALDSDKEILIRDEEPVQTKKEKAKKATDAFEYRKMADLTLEQKKSIVALWRAGKDTAFIRTEFRLNPKCAQKIIDAVLNEYDHGAFSIDRGGALNEHS